MMDSSNSHDDERDVNRSSRFLIVLFLFAGVLLGGLAGAGVMLLLAPQSGKKTRRQIRRKGKKVHKRAARTVKHEVEQVRDKAHRVTANIHEQVEDLQQRDREKLDEGR